MSAHVLMNLLNKLRKSDTMRGLSSLVNSIYHTLNLLKNLFLFCEEGGGGMGCENLKILPSFTRHYNGCQNMM